MSNTLCIGQRFLLNEHGRYTVAGHSGTERIVVELDHSIVADLASHPERSLGKMRSTIQAAARQKWLAGEGSERSS